MYMDVKIKLNGKLIIDSVDQDMVLLDFCRKHNCFSVKRAVSQATAVFVQCFWMESLCCHAACR